MADQEYELFAIRYATRDARRSDHFIGGDPHDGPMPMDYFMWLARGGGRTFVIDTGFNAEVAEGGSGRSCAVRWRRSERSASMEPRSRTSSSPICITTMSEISTGFRTRDSISRNAKLPMPRGASCDIRGYRIRSRSRMSAGSYGSTMRAASCSTMATPSSRPASRYMRRAAIRPGFSSFGSKPAADCRAGLRRQSFLREHGERASVYDRPSYRRNAGGVRQAAETGAGREPHHSRA